MHGHHVKGRAFADFCLVTVQLCFQLIHTRHAKPKGVRNVLVSCLVLECFARQLLRNG